jgi:nicotinamide-nucleotide amidase
MMKLVEKVAKMLKARGETIAVAESSAGGLISANLLMVPGASAYYAGGTVIYTKASRKVFLNLPIDRLKGLKPLTEDMAMVFAETIKQDLQATWGLAELGVAGPGGTPYSHEVGISVIALSGPMDASIIVRTGINEREKNMHLFTEEAIGLIETTLASL